MKYLNCILPLCFLVLLGACTKKQQEESIIKADLSESNIPFNTLFDKMEIIPIETNDSTLIKRTTRFREKNGLYYILDDSQGTLFIFDSSGKNLNRIAKKGQGPEEYIEVSDFAIDSSSNTIAMLALYGHINYYDAKANFIRRVNLPKNLNVYYRIEDFNDSSFVLFSFPVENEDAVTIVSKGDGAKLKGFWNHSVINVKHYETGYPFYIYNNEVFFSVSFSDKIYNLMSDKLQVAYQWNFGENTADFNEDRYLTGDINKDPRRVSDALERGDIPFLISQENQNDKYFYAQLFVKLERKFNLFHNKETKEEFYFEKTKEGFTINPLLMNDKYLISELKYEEKDLFLNSDVLSEKDKEKLKQYKDDDNPWLIKYYFK